MDRARALFSVLAVLALVTAAGCATTRTASEVRADGDLAGYDVEVVLPEAVLENLRSRAEANGTTLEARLRSAYADGPYGSVAVDVTTERRGGEPRGVIRVNLSAFDPAAVEGGNFADALTDPTGVAGPEVSVERADGRVVYVDGSFENASTDTGPYEEFAFALRYRVEMPGDVVASETNADRVEGDVAVWNRTGRGVLVNTPIRAVSEPNAAPRAALTVDPSAPRTDETVTFRAGNSTDPDGDALTYEWDLDGDGEVEATGPTATRAYGSPGERTVTLVVTDDDGGTDTATATVAVSDPGDGRGLPGFGPGAAALALLASVLALALSRWARRR